MEYPLGASTSVEKTFFFSIAIHWRTVYALFEHTLIERWADKLKFHYCGEHVETRTTSVRLSCDSWLVIACRPSAYENMAFMHLSIQIKLNSRIIPTRFRWRILENHTPTAWRWQRGLGQLMCWMCGTCDDDIWHYSFNLMYEMIKWSWMRACLSALHRCHNTLDVSHAWKIHQYFMMKRNLYDHMSTMEQSSFIECVINTYRI